jgi:hypothetical protein
MDAPADLVGTRVIVNYCSIAEHPLQQQLPHTTGRVFYKVFGSTTENRS